MANDSQSGPVSLDSLPDLTSTVSVDTLPDLSSAVRASDLPDISQSVQSIDSLPDLSATGTISAGPPPSILRRVQSALANSTIGTALQSTMPKVAEGLGLTPTATVYDPEYQQNRSQLIAPTELYREPGAIHGALSFAGNLTTPENLTMMAATSGLGTIESQLGRSVLGRLIGGGFSASMLKDAIGQVPQLKQAIETGDYAQAREIAVKMGLGGALAALGVRHATRGRATAQVAPEAVEESITPEVPKATGEFTASSDQIAGQEPPQAGATQPEVASPRGAQQADAPIDPQRFRAEIDEPATEASVRGPSGIAAMRRANPDTAAQIPRPGAASVTNPSAFRSTMGTVAYTLERDPVTRPIAQEILGAEDKKIAWQHEQKSAVADAIKGLSNRQAVMSSEILDTYENPRDALGQSSQRFGRPYDQATINAATQLRDLTEHWHQQATDAAAEMGKEGPGRISNYLAHVQDPNVLGGDLSQSIRTILDHHFSRPLDAIRDLFRENVSSMTDEKGGPVTPRPLGSASPTSRYLEPRTGRLRDYALDPRRVWPAYIESVGRVIFDKPALDQASQITKSLPDGTARELATGYIRNYSRTDAYPQLARTWRNATGALTQQAGRSLLTFSTGLQQLHLARLLVNVLPELNAKYATKAAGEIFKSPIDSFQEAAQKGLLPDVNETPPSLRTPLQKFSNLGNFFGLVDYLPRSLAYKAQLAKYLASGLGRDAAEAAAVADAKKFNLTVSPARRAGIFQNYGSPLDAFRDVTLQFGQVPLKLLEQGANIAANVASDPVRLGKYIAGVGAAYAIHEGTGARTIHLGGQLLSAPAAALPAKILYEFGQAGLAAGNGDQEKANKHFENALRQALYYSVPGSRQIGRFAERPELMLSPDAAPIRTARRHRGE